MNEYFYECQDETCGFLFMVEQRVTDKKRFKKCPACKSYTLERVLLEAPLGFVERDATTVGQQAEKNDKRWGKELISLKQDKILRDRLAAKKELLKICPKGTKIPTKAYEKPWYGKMSNKMTKHFKEGSRDKMSHYIMTGEEKL